MSIVIADAQEDYFREHWTKRQFVDVDGFYCDACGGIGYGIDDGVLGLLLEIELHAMEQVF